jgi:hypothetical protein
MTSKANAMRLVDDVHDGLDQGVGPSDQIVKTLVRRQMNQGGNIMMAGLEPLTEVEFFAGGANGISPAWTMGHLACVLDLFTSWIEGRDLSIARWTHDIFNSLNIEKKKDRTKAESVDPKVLPKGDILLLFRQSQVHALEVLKDFDVKLWERPTTNHVPDTLPTWGAIWQSLGVHPFWHLGELAGCIKRFHGTYTLNTVTHYFYTSADQRSGVVLKEGA